MISNPTGINCGADCDENYASNTTVTLTATAVGSNFAGFSGDVDCVDKQVIMNSAKTCIATFNLNVFAPTVTTNAATNVAATSTTLNGSVTSNGVTATATFDFGTATTYGTSIAASPAQVYSSTPVAVTANKIGLTCGTNYHFRTKAVSSAGTGLGTDKVFATLACPPQSINSWLYPLSPAIIVDRPFAIDLKVNTNNAQVASYDFKLTFNQTRLIVDTTYQNASGQCDQGVCPGSGALNTQMTVVNNDNGTLRLNGFDMEGTGPSNDLQLLVIHFRTRMTTGPTPITLTTVELTTILGDSIGLGAKGTTVTISHGRCGDADGNDMVNIVDALAIARNLIGLPPPPTVNSLLGDVNKSGNLNITDAMFIARYSVGLLIPPEMCNIGQPL